MPLAQLSIRSQRQSSPEVRFDISEVNKVLGVHARRLLAFGLRVQTEWAHGSFHLTRRSIARRLGMTLRQLKCALEILAQANLQWFAGWHVDLASDRGARATTLRHVPKRAFTPGTVNAHGEYVASEALCAWAHGRRKKRQAWGGYRHGRRRLKLRAYLVRRIIAASTLAASSGRETEHPKSRRKTQVGPANDYTFGNKQLSVRLRLPPRSRGRLPDQRGAFRVQNLIGQSLGGRHRQWEISQLGTRLIPEYPGEQIISTVKIPAPPCLASTPEENVRVLATCYRGLLAVKFGQKSRFLLTGAPEGHRIYGQLLRAAEVLADECVPPAAWCLFSADVWRKYRAKQIVPPVFVYALQRIRDDQGWFEQASAQYCGGSVRFAAEHRHLLVDHRNMWAELIRLPTINRAEITRVVDKHFPASTFEARVISAKMQARRMQLQINQALADGGMLWGQ